MLRNYLIRLPLSAILVPVSWIGISMLSMCSDLESQKSIQQNKTINHSGKQKRQLLKNSGLKSNETKGIKVMFDRITFQFNI